MDFNVYVDAPLYIMCEECGVPLGEISVPAEILLECRGDIESICEHSLAELKGWSFDEEHHAYYCDECDPPQRPIPKEDMVDPKKAPTKARILNEFRRLWNSVIELAEEGSLDAQDLAERFKSVPALIKEGKLNEFDDEP